MTIKQKLEILDKAKQEGASEEQLIRLCDILFPDESPSPIGPQTGKITEDYKKSGNDENEEKPSIDLEMLVSNLLHEMGMPANILGYKYLRRAIALCVKDDNAIHAVTKVVYPSIAKEFQTTSSRVERAIRHSIEVAWDRGDIEVLQKYFKYTVDSRKLKPTNGEFIAMLADYLRLQYKL